MVDYRRGIQAKLVNLAPSGLGKVINHRLITEETRLSKSKLSKNFNYLEVSIIMLKENKQSLVR